MLPATIATIYLYVSEIKEIVITIVCYEDGKQRKLHARGEIYFRLYFIYFFYIFGMRTMHSLILSLAKHVIKLIWRYTQFDRTFYFLIYSTQIMIKFIQ